MPLNNTSPAAVALSVGGNNASTTFSGALSGSGSLTKVGSGMLTLTGWNTYSGDTTVSMGTLAILSGQLPAGSEYVGNNGTATLVQSGGTNAAGNLTLASSPGSSGTYNLNGGFLCLSGLTQGAGSRRVQLQRRDLPGRIELLDQRADQPRYAGKQWRLRHRWPCADPGWIAFRPGRLAEGRRRHVDPGRPRQLWRYNHGRRRDPGTTLGERIDVFHLR